MQKLKLYGFKGACSFVPHTALNMAGVDYDLELISHEQSKSPEYLAKNPQGAVPCLEEGDFILTQNVAILGYLDKKFPQAHLFGTGNEQQQAKAHQWLSFANSDVHKTFSPLFNPSKLVEDEKEQPKLIEKVKQSVMKLFKIADDNLAKQDYMAGEFSIADVYLYVTLRWATQMQLDLSNYKNLQKLIKNVESQPAVQKSLKEESLEPISNA